MSRNGKKVIVHDNNLDRALQKFKKKIAEDGLLLELQNRQFYTKPTVAKKIAKAQAVKRWQRYIKSQELPPKLF
jgi:ribosomal protein S21